MDFIAGRTLITILPEEVNQILRNDFTSIIIDVRAPDDFNEGHVPGAINLPKGSWGKISGLQFEQTMIIYCYSISCPLAVKAMQQFVRYGFPVMEMEGGFEAWKENRLPVEISRNGRYMTPWMKSLILKRSIHTRDSPGNDLAGYWENPVEIYNYERL